MSFNMVSSTTMPVQWLFDNSDGASFTDRDTSDTSARTETTISNANDMAIAGSSVIHTSSVDHKQGFNLDPLVTNDFLANDEFFNDFQMLFPSRTREEGIFLSEDVRLPS
jgi:hypothetical protein